MRSKPISTTIFAVLFLSLFVRAENGKTPTGGIFAANRWRLELQGGIAMVKPAGLDLFVDRTEFLLDDYIHRLEILQQWAPEYFHYTMTRSAEAQNLFHKLKSIFLGNLALRYFLTARFSVALGVSYIGGASTSNVEAEFDIKNASPDDYPVWGESEDALWEMKFLDSRVSVQGWIPRLDVQYSLPVGRRFSLGAFVGGGPIFASFRNSYNRTKKYTYPDGFWEKTEWEIRNEGKGVGLALAAGLRCGWKLSSRVEFFAAASQQWQKVNKITGSAQTSSRNFNLEAQERLPQFETAVEEGRWMIFEGSHTHEDGTKITISYPVIPNNPYMIDHAKTPFRLDLSGFQIHCGVSFGF